LRVAFFSDTYLPNIDGVVSSIVSFKKELEKEGHHVKVFAPGVKTIKRDDIFLYRSVVFPPYPQYRLALGLDPLFDFNDGNFDIIHCHGVASMGLNSILSSKLFRKPSISTFHTMLPLATSYISKNHWMQEFLSGFSWSAIRVFYSSFDVVLAPSLVIKKSLEEHGVKNVKVLGNGVDLDVFKPKQNYLKKKLGLSGKTVMFAGRMTKEKNVDVLIKAIPTISKEVKSSFLFVGDGPELENLKLKARGLKNVFFTGRIPYSEMPFYINACDVSVSASTFETFGLSLLESMACGKPVVGADSLAIPEFVSEKNGGLFEPFDVDGLTEKVVEILKDEKKYKSKSANALKTAEKFSIENETKKLVGFYESLI
jgi:1,2-diacylglycerol 3-alpha-glucosyltransferase